MPSGSPDDRDTVAYPVVFDGAGTDAGAYLNGNATVDGILFTHCRASSGAGARCDWTGATVRDCTFHQNTATTRSAGVYVAGADDVTVERCTFSENDCPQGTCITVTEGHALPQLAIENLELNPSPLTVVGILNHNAGRSFTRRGTDVGHHAAGHIHRLSRIRRKPA